MPNFRFMVKQCMRLFGKKLEGSRLARALWLGVIRPALLHIDPEGILTSLGSDEEFELALFRKHLRPGDIVLDIGANIGLYTIIAARIVGQAAGRVYAFEPDPLNCRTLRSICGRLGLVNVSVVEKAVVARSGLLRLFRSRQKSGDHRTYDPGDERDVITIEGVSIDEWITKNVGGERVDVIKMDIQGAEHQGLYGMVQTLRRNKGVKLFVEFWPHGLRACGNTPEEFLALLLDQGFNLWSINERERSITPVSAEELLHLYTPENNRYTNLFCQRPVMTP